MSDKKKPQMIQVIQVNIGPSQPRIEDVHPCLVGRHRAAWLNNGQVACGICGAPL